MDEGRRVSCIKSSTMLMCRLCAQSRPHIPRRDRSRFAEDLRVCRRNEGWEGAYTLLAWAALDWPEGRDA
jgi:hypothetical protein